MRVSEVRVYPVKSLAGVRVDEAAVEAAGLRGDRRWMVVLAGGRDEGEVLTARECHAMLGVAATPIDDPVAGAIRLSAPGREALTVLPPGQPPDVPVRLSRLDRATDAGPAAGAWLSEALRQPVRLVWLDDPARRPVGLSHGGTGVEPLSLADAGPLLLTSTASLRQLNDWVAAERLERGEDGDPLAMLRFRPSVVVDGAPEAFAEDHWARVRIGEVEYRFAELCDRCVLTTLDPVTLVGGKEPLRTLARYRKWDGKTWFGVRLIPLGPGTLREGDEVRPLTAL